MFDSPTLDTTAPEHAVTGFVAGLEHVAGRCHAWIQPDGGWGLSNTGLIRGDGESVLVDTLFDLPHTARMLDGFASLTRDAPIRTLVNTHGNGDHWFGNQLLPGVDIIAARDSVLDMHAVGPATVHQLVSMPGDTGDYAREIFGRFEFADITPTYPTRTFETELALDIAGVEVALINVGPAHTRGDTIVFCPEDGVVFTGDIVFAGGTPIVWAGPLSNWIAACERIVALGAAVLVPGHGPVCPVATVTTMIDYLQFVHAQASRRHSAGMTAQQAARDIDLGIFARLPESERLAVNVAAVYRELDPPPTKPDDGPALFGCMAELHATKQHQPG